MIGGATPPPVYVQVRLARVVNDQTHNTRQPVEHKVKLRSGAKLPQLNTGNKKGNIPIYAYVPAEERRTH
eukprot:1798342-Amphidinium_carterae.1